MTYYQGHGGGHGGHGATAYMPQPANAQNQPAWHNLPLPAGWEAKYDAGTKRYFFINHSEHTTSWVDPRQPKPQQLQPSPQFRQPSPQRSPQPSPRRSTPESIPLQDMKPSWQKDVEREFQMDVSLFGSHEDSDDEESLARVDDEQLRKMKDMFPSAPEKAVRIALVKSKGVDGMAVGILQSSGYQRQNVPQSTQILMRIKKEYPNVDQTLLKDLIRASDNNESKVKQQLKELGYQPMNSSSRPSSRTATPTRANDHLTTHTTHTTRASTSPSRSPGRASSPGHGTSSSSHHQHGHQDHHHGHHGHHSSSHATPARTSPPKMSESNKNKLKDNMQKEFSGMPHMELEMALDACHYDEDKTRTLLRSMESTSKIRKAAAKSVDVTVTSSSSTSYSSYTSSTAASSTSTITTGVTSPRTSTSTAPKVTSPTRRSASPASRPSSSTPSKTTTSAAPKRVTPKATDKTTRPTTRQPVRRTQPIARATTASTYTSANKCTPKGPDPSLISGSNKSLLISEYMPQAGPKLENHQGPQRTNLLSANRCPAKGPDRSIRCGPNTSLAQGSMYGRNVLVTNV